MLGKITKFSMDKPWVTIGAILVITAVFLLQFPKISIDTDPENMLQVDQVDRAYYDEIKEEFDIDDIIVVGIIDNKGVFRSEALKSASLIIDDIKKIDLTYTPPAETESGNNKAAKSIPAIRKEDLVSIATSKNMFNQNGEAKASLVMDELFLEKPADDQLQEWIAKETEKISDFIAANNLEKPTTYDEMLDLKIRKMQYDIKDTPFLNERITSDDGTAMAIYIPITSKKVAYPVTKAIEEIIEKHRLEGQEFHVAGLPIAEETFGHEMFIQMAVVAPLAFFLIMLIVYLLFKQPMFLIPVGITSALSVIWAMGLLIGMDFTVHIMSSMIPVFLLPIAILNSVHILSQFFDRFKKTGKKEESLLWAMNRLYLPMFFTSLTSAVGFASLAMADIPPVQVFGVFVSFGIAVAWLFSLTLVPAMVNLFSEEKLAKRLGSDSKEQKKSFLDKILIPIGNITYKHAAWVLVGSLVLTIVGVVGIMIIQVNDNPVKWFKEGHPIRVADTVMNAKFGGTYMTNLVIEGAPVPESDEDYIRMLETAEFPNILNKPEVAKYISALQAHLESHPLVGKASSIYDGAKRVRYVLQATADADLSPEERKAKYYAIAQANDFKKDDTVKQILFERNFLDNLTPEEEDKFYSQDVDSDFDTPEYKNFTYTEEEAAEVLAELGPQLQQTAFQDLNYNVAQFDFDQRTRRDMQKLLVTKQRELENYSGGKIRKVWEKANIWIQLKSGDNQNMQKVIALLDEYKAEHPVPDGVKITWTGLTYINKVWQDLMVNGMLFAIIGSFAIVFILMLIEFRSLLLGILSMIPLTLALVLSYGLMGWLGKDYDMPIAVCSSLSLGLAVDFAIHFLQRYKNHLKESGSIEETQKHMFEEPGRAILRNAIVIALGFLPLMVSSLTPYVTVGSFFSLLMVMATLATIFVLPAAMKYLAPIVLKKYVK